MLRGAALSSFAARFCWQGQHFRLWTVPERVSGPPPLDAARRSTFEPRGSLAARFCWQGQHFRLWTVPERVSGPFLDAARRSTFEPRGSFSAGRGSTSGSGRCPSAFSGPPPLDAARRELRGSFLLAGAALQGLDGARARCGAPPPRCCHTHTYGSFLLGQHFRLWTVPERVSGPPPLNAARRAARFCWQGQHFRLWTVPERVSGPPPLDAARRSTFEPEALDGARARFGAPPP